MRVGKVVLGVLLLSSFMFYYQALSDSIVVEADQPSPQVSAPSWRVHDIIMPVDPNLMLDAKENQHSTIETNSGAMSQQTYEVPYTASQRLAGCTPGQRMAIESGGNYGTYTGNGYVGAYQFSEQYLAGWCDQAGIPYNGTQDFLNNPSAQDQLANWYAGNRYGGWENVPSSGGW